MAGDAGFAVDTLNPANHSMKMKCVRLVVVGHPILDPDNNFPNAVKPRSSQVIFRTYFANLDSRSRASSSISPKRF